MNKKSLWQSTTTFDEKAKLNEHISTPVAIIGGGMTGILCAYLLKEKGIDSVILEAEQIAHGVTAYTTGKITPQHNLIYAKLLNRLGNDKAKQYLCANIDACQKFKELVMRNNINCDYEEMPNVIYTRTNRAKILEEIEAANKLGLPSELIENSPLPIPILAGIKNYYSAQFNPLKFLHHLARDLTIYEHTPVTKVRGNQITTPHGTITADKIIMACHFPIKDLPGCYFMRITQSRTYLMALRQKEKLDAMYLDEAESGMTFRSYNEYLIMGGMTHPTGCGLGAAFASLEKLAETFYPASPVEFIWSAQDCMSLDDMPYIGKYSPFTPSLYVATGYNKWGMSGAMVSAMLLSDRLTNRHNPYAQVFTPQRMHLCVTGKTLFKNGKNYLFSLKEQLFGASPLALEDVQKGEGKVVEINHHKKAVYRDEAGKYHIVDAKCSHLGCLLIWNMDDKSWDCPCHGSRFDIDGNVIGDPARQPLKQYFE